MLSTKVKQCGSGFRFWWAFVWLRPPGTGHRSKGHGARGRVELQAGPQSRGSFLRVAISSLLPDSHIVGVGLRCVHYVK